MRHLNKSGVRTIGAVEAITVRPSVTSAVTGTVDSGIDGGRKLGGFQKFIERMYRVSSVKDCKHW